MYSPCISIHYSYRYTHKELDCKDDLKLFKYDYSNLNLRLGEITLGRVDAETMEAETVKNLIWQSKKQVFSCRES